MAEVVTKTIQILALLLFLFGFLVEKVLSDNNNDPKLEKLILTPYLKSPKLIEEVRTLSRVQNLSNFTDQVESYSGFLTVDPICESNLFFWFFPSAVKREESPIILWHGGGPGSSGLLGLFEGTGPFYVDDEGQLQPRTKKPWTLSRSVLYVDSPVGSGFSENADLAECYVGSTSTAAKHIYEALTQFYKVFSEFQKNKLFIFTGSYGGKFAPAIAYEIHHQNKNQLNNIAKTTTPSEFINLKGISITSGFSDPISQIDYGDFYHSVGLIDNHELVYFREQENLAKVNIRHGKWGEAFDIIEPLIIGVNEVPSHLMNITGLAFPYNFLMNYKETPSYVTNHITFLNQEKIRKAIHVDFSKNFSNGNSAIYNKFREDIYQSVKPLVEELLDSGLYRFHIASTQLDLVVPHTTIANFVQSLNWKFATEFRDSETKRWITETGDVGGFFKTVDNLTYFFYRNSGHMWAKDQPEMAQEIMKAFTEV